MDRSYPSLIVGLVVIFGGLYIFNPASSFLARSDQVSAEAVQTHAIEIRSGGLIDPRQADLRIKLGEKQTLLVSTDEDGRVDLKGSDRSTFNPVFSGTINSLTIPTDKAGSYQIEFHPNARPDSETEGIVLGTIVIEK